MFFKMKTSHRRLSAFRQFLFGSFEGVGIKHGNNLSSLYLSLIVFEGFLNSQLVLVFLCEPWEDSFQSTHNVVCDHTSRSFRRSRFGLDSPFGGFAVDFTL